MVTQPAAATALLVAAGMTPSAPCEFPTVAALVDFFRFSRDKLRFPLTLLTSWV